MNPIAPRTCRKTNHLCIGFGLGYKGLNIINHKTVVNPISPMTVKNIGWTKKARMPPDMPRLACGWI
jgi:hypothetical protein